ncbi:MAG: selenocysteine-specific translation elongation factor [bacterium]
MPVIGTAGHVDHGKSTLIHALTGIDPDRLREEKERGLTIDLGFAWLKLPSGEEVGVVDVPGHERFIKNMLAGAGGMDLALLVVAADEGPRPQTAEHLAILDLLEVPAGIVVLTKCDLVEPDYADLVEAELEDTVRGTRLAGAPMVRVSATTRAGLDKLLVAIDESLSRLTARRDVGRARLPIDRVFTIPGFGTVVTGTLIDGALSTGDEMVLLPGEIKCRVRGLQRHRTKTDRLGPGTRAAVNLSGVHTDDIRRGMVLARPGALQVAQNFVLRLSASQILQHPIRHDSELTLLTATAESQCKVRLLDADALDRGASCWAQLVLDTPIAALARDHVILRTPDETVGGGPIVSLNGKRLRRNHTQTLDSLEKLLAGSPAERVRDALMNGPRSTASLVAELGLNEAVVYEAISGLASQSQISDTNGRLVGAPWLDARQQDLLHSAREFLAANPLRRAVPREHLRRSVGLESTEFDLVLNALGETVEVRGSGIAPAGYEPKLSPFQQAEVEAFMASLAMNPHSPPTDHLPSAPLLSYLVERGDVEDTGAGVVFSADAFAGMVGTVRDHFRANETLSLAETRDMFGTSRKYAQALLEHLDALHITRRTGETRTLR